MCRQGKGSIKRTLDFCYAVGHRFHTQRQAGAHGRIPPASSGAVFCQISMLFYASASHAHVWGRMWGSVALAYENARHINGLVVMFGGHGVCHTINRVMLDGDGFWPGLWLHEHHVDLVYPVVFAH